MATQKDGRITDTNAMITFHVPHDANGSLSGINDVNEYLYQSHLGRVVLDNG